MDEKKAIELQRKYYRETAAGYDDLHLEADPEHQVALELLVEFAERHEFESILDLGSGTGRVLQFFGERSQTVRVVGIEPVSELRKIGHEKGISPETLVDGDATGLSYEAGSFDLVCAFGLLHHVPRPELVVGEMLRVARRAIFISDSNNFGQGGLVSRTVKQLINAVGLWKLANLLKTRGRGYIETEGDGISFSYSVFNNYDQIAAECEDVRVLNTAGSARNLYREAPHVALFASKTQQGSI